MRKIPLFLLVGLIGLASPAVAQQNFVAQSTGSVPATVNLGVLFPTSSCVYTGLSALAVGQATPLPCNSNGHLMVDTYGGGAASVAVAPTLAASSHAAGTSMGGLMTFTGATVGNSQGLLQNVAVTFASGIQPPMDLVLFNANPTSSTITDNVAVAVASADLGKEIQVIHITDWLLTGTPSLGQALGQSVEFVLPNTSMTIYACLILRAAATPGSTSDMNITLNFAP